LIEESLNSEELREIEESNKKLGIRPPKWEGKPIKRSNTLVAQKKMEQDYLTEG
jgi:hypothetical protein